MKTKLAQAAQYVANTAGNATLEHFIDDHDPIGNLLWADLLLAGYAEEHEGRVRLTELGEQFREANQS